MLHQDAGVDRHVVDALFGLLFDHVDQEVVGDRLGALRTLDCLVDRHRTDRNGGVSDVRLADRVEVLAGAQIHHRVRPVVNRRVELFEFLGAVARGLAVADVGVDLRGELAADDHRIETLVGAVRRDHCLVRGHLLADERGVAVLVLGDPLHRRRDPPLAGGLQLRSGSCYR